MSARGLGEGRLGGVERGEGGGGGAKGLGEGRLGGVERGDGVFRRREEEC